MPLGYILVRRICIVTLSLRKIAPRRTTLLDTTESHAVPSRTYRSLVSTHARVNLALMKTTVVEVREPHFFCGHIHMLLVEDAGMSNERIKRILVSSTEIIY